MVNTHLTARLGPERLPNVGDRERSRWRKSLLIEVFSAVPSPGTGRCRHLHRWTLHRAPSSWNGPPTRAFREVEMPTKREQFVQTIRAQWLGQRMRELREERGLTLKYIAAYLGVEFSTLARYER